MVISVKMDGFQAHLEGARGARIIAGSKVERNAPDVFASLICAQFYCSKLWNGGAAEGKVKGVKAAVTLSLQNETKKWYCRLFQQVDFV